MKIRIAAPLLLSALAAPVHAADYMDSAPVVSSVPVYQTVSEPQQQCWTESVTRYEERRTPGGALLGGLLLMFCHADDARPTCQDVVTPRLDG